MILAFWCVLAAAILPYLTVSLAKSQRGYNNRAPREWAQHLEGWRKRAYAAHQNGFEVFPFFAASVLIAFAAGAPHDAINTLALFFIPVRIAYVACYVANLHALRSLFWLLGFALCIVLACAPVLYG
jgi:uncharacterized MAPEG superfamily protein